MSLEERKIKDVATAEEIALQACREIGGVYPYKDDVDSVTLSGNKWLVEITCYNESISLEIDALSGHVMKFSRKKK